MASKPKLYRDMLTADVNEKGVLDIDVVKGCTMGMAARPDGGCYNACYASTIAKFRGLDFTQSVVRTVQTASQAEQIERAVKAAPEKLFRIGTMGDPCHAWQETVEVVEWLAPYATPVIVTKHWMRASDEQFRRLIACGTILNTSISALDKPAELRHREREMARYVRMGGHSTPRVVSCEFNAEHPEGARMAAIQARLLALPNIIDNPLRVPRTHRLVVQGIIKLTVVRDLVAMRTISLAQPNTYLGHCAGCPDKCGRSTAPADHPRPSAPQLSLI